ncbi:hypothetical protein ZWY2020_017411 [Hordeum vulgare]|nr:hypothetical protein ZWY2020_017411 [Hordeum vulgare]
MGYGLSSSCTYSSLLSVLCGSILLMDKAMLPMKLLLLPPSPLVSRFEVHGPARPPVPWRLQPAFSHFLLLLVIADLGRGGHRRMGRWAAAGSA